MSKVKKKRREDRMKHRVRGGGEFPVGGYIGGGGLLMRSSRTAREILRRWRYDWNRGFRGVPSYAIS